MAIVLAALLAALTVTPSLALAAPAQSRHTQEQWVRVYTVRPGDTLGGIALRYGVTIEALMRANGITNPNRIYVGQQLIIPDAVTRPGTGGPQCDTYHVVRRGETLSGIALRYGLDVYTLARANGIYDLNSIYAGQSLCIPGRGPVTPMPQPQPAPRPQPQPQPPQQRPPGPLPGPGPMPGPGPIPQPHPKPQPPLGSDPFWKGQYFADKYFSHFVTERQDPEVRFNWFKGAPFEGMPQDRFSVRWEKFEYFKAGTYRFFAIADDGVRVYVDDQLIIDGWKIQPATEYRADLFLHEGRHKLVVEYYEEAEDAQIHVYWEALKPAQPQIPVQPSRPPGPVYPGPRR